ncbi:MAG: TonB family protein [Myxococcota bacterium]
MWLPLIASVGWAGLPAVLSSVPAPYPPEALERGETARVVLELDLDAAGVVRDARVVESGGEAFDRAALGAVRSYVWSPATTDAGEPVPATLQYAVVFEPTQAPPLSLEGTVRAAGTRERLSGVDVVVSRGDERQIAVTDEEGRFRFAGLADGGWGVTVSARGYRDESTPVEVTAGKVAGVVLYPVEDRPWETSSDGVTEEVTVVGRRVAPELTERVLSSEELRYLPGTAGDVVRVVQNLPGVARPPLGIGQLVIRGTAPEDSAYYLDGAPIPNVFHFAGFSTVLSADAVDEIALLSGNYGARYGRTLGGVVDLRTHADLPERSRGYVSVDLFQTTVFTEQRFGRSAVSVSGRRSYVDAVLNPILNSSGASQIRAPRYYDFQARVNGETRSGGTFDAMFLVSDDAFRVVGEDDAVTIGLGSSFTKLRLLSEEPLGESWRNEVSMILGPEDQTFAFAGTGEAYERPFTVAAREEVSKAAPERGVGVGWRMGLDVLGGSWRYSYAIPGFGDPEGANVARLLPAAYIEPSVRLGPLSVVPGLRADGAWVGPWSATALDPRLGTSLRLGPSTTIEASAGGYSQLPTVRQVIDEPTLRPQRAWQTSAGLEQKLGSRATLEVTAFDNWLTDLVSGREDAFRFFSGPPPIGPLDTDPYANDGTGRIYGVEGMIRYGTERTAAWLSATFARSTRTDRPGDVAELFDYDQPVVLTALASQELPRRWRIGARFRVSSGNPYTPVVNRFFDLDNRAWVPVYDAEVDGERLPGFGSIDVRVDKDIVYRNWTLTLYVDAQNVTNRQNIEVMSWTDDFSAEAPITGLPVVPAFGVRGEW